MLLEVTDVLYEVSKTLREVLILPLLRSVGDVPGVSNPFLFGSPRVPRASIILCLESVGMSRAPCIPSLESLGIPRAPVFADV